MNSLHLTNTGAVAPVAHEAESIVAPRPRAVRLFGFLLPTVIALGFIGGLAYLGQTTGWSLPKFSALLGRDHVEEDDWCVAHSVAESVCVECRKELWPVEKDFGWCRTHGIPNCTLEHPEVAQLSIRGEVTPEDRERAARALAFTKRTENNSKCKLHERRIQFSSTDEAAKLGIDVGLVRRAPVHETIVANGEIAYDPTRVARLSSRVPGTVKRVEKQLGDRVRAGEVLALVDAADVGKAKAELQQALTQMELKRTTLVRLRELEGVSVSGQSVLDAEAGLEEAKVRLLTAEQTLVNLGLTIDATVLQGKAPDEIARRMQFLGIPDSYAKSLGDTASSNLIAITSAIDGEVIARSAVSEERADSTRVLFVVADTRQMWLQLKVRLEDAGLLKPGLHVRFQHEGHDDWDLGTVTWISPAADEKTRTVPVRVSLANSDGRHHAHTFGSARVVLREESSAIVVPSDAVHWEGDCHIVFVRDRQYSTPGAPKVFHVRKVRPGATDGTNTEIIAGLLPGEWVATNGSGIMRAELLKNNLGEG